MPLHPERRILNQTTYYAHVTLGAPSARPTQQNTLVCVVERKGEGAKRPPLRPPDLMQSLPHRCFEMVACHAVKMRSFMTRKGSLTTSRHWLTVESEIRQALRMVVLLRRVVRSYGSGRSSPC
jgi:hypothetical protein